MNYDVIATLGPGSTEVGLWEEMIAVGVTGFRLNTSHLTLEQLDIWLNSLYQFFGSTGIEKPVVLDLQGSKWRIGKIDDMQLEEGQQVSLICAVESDQEGVLPVPHADFFTAALSSGKVIVLNDAKVRLMVEDITQGEIRALVTLAGPLSGHKGITFASSDYRKESMSEKDQAIVEKTRSLKNVRYALSYVKDAEEMKSYRQLLGKEAYLIAKIERRPAIDEATELAKAADELWLCRGDLGAELGLAEMAAAVNAFSRLVRHIDIPVMMAGQVLEHMTVHHTPTRSEVCYLFDSLEKGYAGFVLSDEVAVGSYPLDSCRIAAMFKS